MRNLAKIGCEMKNLGLAKQDSPFPEYFLGKVTVLRENLGFPSGKLCCSRR